MSCCASKAIDQYGMKDIFCSALLVMDIGVLIESNMWVKEAVHWRAVTICKGVPFKFFNQIGVSIQSFMETPTFGSDGAKCPISILDWVSSRGAIYAHNTFSLKKSWGWRNQTFWNTNGLSTSYIHLKNLQRGEFK